MGSSRKLGKREILAGYLSLTPKPIPVNKSGLTNCLYYGESPIDNLFIYKLSRLHAFLSVLTLTFIS